jgi:hypothetical protein
MDGKRVIAKAYAYSAANRVMFQTGLYCFPQDDIIGYGEEKEIEETESTQNTRPRHERNGTPPISGVRPQTRRG